MLRELMALLDMYDLFIGKQIDMALATGGKLRQFVVEFIRDVGIKTNGIVDTSQGTTGPFVWRVPSDVGSISLVLVAGGSGGSGGGVSSASVISVGGGGGGAGGYTTYGLLAPVVPNTDLKITVGRGATSSPAGSSSNSLSAANASNATQVEPNTVNDFGILGAQHQGTAGLVIASATLGSFAGSASTSTFANGGNSGGTSDSGGSGAGGSTAGANGGGAANNSYELLGGGCRLTHLSVSGTGGGAGGSTAGATGGNGGSGGISNANLRRLAPATAGLGTSTGVLSLGGGGNGGATFFGRGGLGGNGGSPGNIGQGYGAGGGGGGGNAAGAGGTHGYARFTYWSAK